MPSHTKGLHHYQVRKRIHKHHEPYPNPDKFKNFIDKGIYGAGIIGPIMTIPQLYKIWVLQSASGVSVISWITYLITAVFWLIYGILHKEKPIIVTYSLWIFLDIFIVIGTLIYG